MAQHILISVSDARTLERWLNDAAIYYRLHARNTREFNRASQLNKFKKKIHNKIPMRDDDT